MILGIRPYKVGNYLAEFVPETAPLGKLTEEVKEVADEAHQYVSNSMFAAKKTAKNPAAEVDDSVDKFVGSIINFFG